MGVEVSGIGELEELVATRSVRVCRVGSLFVQAWSDQATTYEHDLIDEAFDDMIARYPGGFCSLTLIRMASTPGPTDADLRQRARAQARKVEPYNRASAIVFAGPGVLGHGIRMFMKVLMLKNRSEVPNHVCDTLSRALDWLLAVEGVDPALVAHRDELEQTIESWWGPAA